MMRDGVKYLMHDDPRGWPMCVKCARPVELVMEAMADGEHGFFMFCHGRADFFRSDEPGSLNVQAFGSARKAAP